MMNRKTSLVLLLSFFACSSVYAQMIVRTSEELQDILIQDEDVGIVLLDGDCFQIEGAIVNVGGIIRPYGKRKPVLIGSHQAVRIKEGEKIQGGYWTRQIIGNGAVDYIFLDENFEAIGRSKNVDGRDFMYVKASDLQRLDKVTRSIKIKIPQEFSSLLYKNENDLKNAKLKITHWFVQMDVYHLKSDGLFLYGQIDNSYHYNLLDIRPNAIVQVSFFNFPIGDGGAYVDGKDVLHVPEGFSTAKVCCSNNIFTLQTNRKLIIEGITFSGSMKPVEIKGANKHLYKCSFLNCGSGVCCDYGVKNRDCKCSVRDCRFENMYNNDVITFIGCDDITISNNTIHNTGILNKGGSVIRVGGDRFNVKQNIIKSYSYIAINASISRDYAKAKLTGYIDGNLIDNAENWEKKDRQLTDGGGIYVLTHTDGVVIENNIVRNIGYEGCELWGIYLDDGAYNCTVRRNLVYNLWPGQYAMTARYVEECEHTCMNNVVENNIFIGPCKIAGNRKGFGNKTIIRNNYIAGDLNTQGDEYVLLKDNQFVTASVRNDGKIVFGKKDKIKKRGFASSIKKLIKR